MSSHVDAGSSVFSHAVSGMTLTDTTATRPLVTQARRTVLAHSSMGGPREMDLRITDNPSAKKTDVESGDVKHINAQPSSIDQTFEPDCPSLRRRQSAKQLIHRFESMTRGASTAQYGRSSGSTGTNSDTGANHPFLSLTRSKSKRRSLSHSLRNFVAVFKRRRDKDQDDSDHTLPRSSVEIDCDGVNSHPFRPKPAPLPERSVRQIALSTSKASALLSGPLHYLSRPSPSASSILPVWTSCTVTLYDSHLLLTWYTLHGNPSSQVFPLGGCMDVHSLALKQLDANERALLPRNGNDDLKIFELLFEGRTPEKFAAASSHDRGQWVSAIWDTVLNSRCSPGPGRDYGPRGALTVKTDVPLLENRLDGLQPHSASEHSASVYSSSSAVETPSMFAKGDSAPPTPIAKSPRQGNSPATLSPPRPPSELSTHTQPKSPSIAKLGTLSVVTQRLAEISQAKFASSTPTTDCTSSTTVTALQRAQMTYSTPVTRAFTEIEHTPRKGSMSVGTPVDEDGGASTVIPLPDIAKTLPSDNVLARSRSVFSKRSQLPIAPAQWSIATSTTLEPIPQSQTTLPEPAIGTNDKTPLNSPLAPSIEPQLLPFAELIKENAAKHYDQAAALGEQIIALQRDIHNLPEELKPTITREIAAMIEQDERQGKIYRASMDSILAKLDDVQKYVAVDGIVTIVENVQVQLASQIPEVIGKLASIQRELQAVREASSEMPGCSTRSGPKMNLEHAMPPIEKGPRSGTHLAVDLSAIYAKLDDLASLYRTDAAIEEKDLSVSPLEQDSSAISEKLQAILDQLKASGEQRELQLVQQVDSVRYLNELNSWLDAFVNNGTVQIQAIAAGVEQLCEQFGVDEDVEGKDHQGDRQKILPTIRQLLSFVQKKAQDEEQLQVSVAQLTSAVHEHLKIGADQENTIVTNSVLAIIDRQRHDQEQLLRALSSELTNEIRGERLRFVEAMKEATAINVQAHVEHFKAELSREVAVMTEDVGRLHQEKQALEQQIADLFAFYSKQKQEADVRGHSMGSSPTKICRTVERTSGAYQVNRTP
ncbi:hypothetical protein F5I97DRAFT_743616 [Phlebopus sp. FC_14]|nr:hypothetical protein F5I97DRAFT_743616 [Phlebopus sp. FC_14]